MKKIILLIAVAQIFGCAPDSGSSSSGAGLACNIPGATAGSEVDNNQDISTSQSQDVDTLAKYENFIVKYKDATAQPAVGLQPSGNPVHDYTVTGVTFRGIANKTYTVSVKLSGEEKKNFLKDMMSKQEVEFVEPDYPIQASQEVPGNGDISEQTVATQWALQKVAATTAWKTTTGSNDIVVGILDSGVDYLHQDLKRNVWVNPGEIAGNGKDDDGNGYVDDVYGWNFNANNPNSRTSVVSNHGSHVAGIIGGNRGDGNGILGLAPNVKMMPLKFMGDTGTGSTSDAIRGIDYAIKKKVFAINNSWGSGSYSTALKDAITRAEQAGILFIVAAGNDGRSLNSSKWYPASYTNSNILNVGSTTSSDSLSSFSNYGSIVDVAAPGSSILSTVTNNAYQTKSGTSMATPLVTGLAVLVKAANPTLNFAQVINVIRGSVDKFSSMATKIATGGRVNAAKAVALAASNAPIPGTNTRVTGLCP